MKFYDFLQQDEGQPQKDYIFAKDEKEHWHQMLANWCEQDNLQLIWEDALSNRSEQERRIYARNHFIEHLYFAQDWLRVFAVLDSRSFGQRKVYYDPSMRSFSNDLDLGRKAAASRNWSFDEGISLLPRLWRYTLLRCSLAGRADRYPEAAFFVLMMLNREREALGLAELLTDPTKKAYVLITMANVQEQQAKGEESRKQNESFLNLLMRVYEVACTIENNFGRAWILCKLGATLAHAQEREQAIEVWAEAEGMIATFNDALDHRRSLHELIKSLVQAQEWAEAEQVIAAIEDSQEHAWALRVLGEALAHAQERERALEVWAQAERVITTIDDSYVRAFALCKLGEALAQVQEGERAYALWIQAEGMIATIDDSDRRASSVRELGVTFAHAQEWVEAERVIATIEDSQEHAWALRVLGEALAQAQEWAQAERVIATIVDSQEHAWALRELGEALAQAQEWAQAERVIATIADSNQHAWALRELGEALAQAQERERALEVWAQAERAIATIADSYIQALALSELGVALAQAQERERALEVWAQAERVITTIKDNNNRTEAMSDLGEALARAQEWAQAERVIASIEHRLLGSLKWQPFLHLSLA